MTFIKISRFFWLMIGAFKPVDSRYAPQKKSLRELDTQTFIGPDARSKMLKVTTASFEKGRRCNASAMNEILVSQSRQYLIPMNKSRSCRSLSRFVRS